LLFTLPSGVILVTKGLLETMQSESELVSILAHELGHIERGHCFDVVKYELLARKIKSEKLGELAIFRDYFSSQPSLALRIAKFEAQAQN